MARNNFKRSTRSGYTKKTSSSNGFDIRKQNANYQTRLQNMGVAPEEVTDKRNWLEKALNLEKDQNVLFDIFEVLGRPQQALFGGIKSVQEGGDFGEGAKAGITGEEDTQFKDILVNAGMKDREGKLDLSDVLGFAGDVVLDPMDVPLLPVSAATKGASTLAKGVKLADKAIDAASDTSKAIRLMSPSEGVFRLAGKGIKAGAKIGDKVTEGALKLADKAYDSKVARIAAREGTTAEKIAERLGGNRNLLEGYRGLKQGISETLDSSKLFGGFAGRARQAENSALLGNAQQKAVRESFADTIQETAENYAKKTGGDATQYFDDIDKNLVKAIEYERDLSIDPLETLNRLNTRKGVDLGSNANAQKFVDALNKRGIKASIVNGEKGAERYVKLSRADGFEAFKQSEEALKDISKLKLDPMNMLKEESDLGKAARDFFSSDADLENLYQQAKSIYKDVNKTGELASGVKLTNMPNRDSFISHILTDDERQLRNVKGGRSPKAMAEQKYGSVTEANLLNEERLTKSKEQTQKAISREESKIYKTKEVTNADGKIETVLDLDKNGNKVISEDYYNEMQQKLKNSMEGLTSKQETLNNALKAIKEGKAVENIEKLPKKVQSAINNYNKSVQKAQNLVRTNLKNVTNPAIIDDVVSVTEDFNKASDAISTGKKLTNAQAESLEKATTKMDIAGARVAGNTDNIAKNNVKAFQQGIRKGEKAALATQKASMNTESLNLLKQSLADMSDGLTSRINKYVDEINKFEGEGFEVFKDRTLQRIADNESKLKMLKEQGSEMLETSFLGSLDGYITKSQKQMEGAKVFNEAIASGIFDGNDYIKTAEDLVGNEKNLTKISGSQLSDILDSYKGVLPENSGVLKDLVNKYKGKTLYMDKRLASILKVGKQSVAQANGLVKLLDGINNAFKKFKVLTPGFQMRNIAGNATNMALSGMPVSAMPKYYTKAVSTINGMPDLINKVATKGLDSLDEAEQASYKLIQQFYDGGFTKAGSAVQDLDDIRTAIKTSKSPLNKVANFNASMNEKMDAINRMTLLMYANDHPKYLQKLGVDNAIDAVKYTLFDPSNMSDVEKNFMKRLVPFYTFTKQNLLFQATNIARNAPRYNKLIKGLNSMYDSLDENSYFGYQKDSMQLPLPWTDDDGNQMFLKTNLPLSDLGEWFSNPLNRTVSSLTPAIKTPFEMVTGVDTFTGQDLSTKKTAAESALSAMGIDLPEGAKSTAQKAEQILSSLGLDTITTNMVKKVSKVLDNYNGDASGQEVWAEIFRSIMQNTNQEKVENSKLYQEMEDYQNYIKSLKNRGIDVPTIREINAANKIKLNNFSRKRNKNRSIR